jgi:HD-GYP domain-containing protein (c-di-GMP phosphodiesterase class II)
MSNILYASDKINLRDLLKKIFGDCVVFTSNYTKAVQDFSGILISPYDSDSSLQVIKEANYPVLIQGESKEQNIHKDMNTYFYFDQTLQINILKQITDNYFFFLEEKKSKLSFRENHINLEKLNKELLYICVALSAERDNSKLLKYIVEKACEITKADAGSLYLLEFDKAKETTSMLFKISHNDSSKTDFTEFRMPLVKKSIAGYVGITGNVLNIDDVYLLSGDTEYSFNNSFDIKTNYRTKSTLTVPMKNHKEKIIGVIQLINKKKEKTTILTDIASVKNNVVPFDKLDEDIILSLASLAAVSLDNNQLYNDIEYLFECLVTASVKAIEQRDPATSGHSLKVAQYTIETAKAISAKTEGVFKDVYFSEEHLKGLSYACFLHDFGKVGVRENVLLKAKKLYPGMLEQIMMRFDNISASIRIKTLEQKLSILLSSKLSSADYERRAKELDDKEKDSIAKMERFKEVIIQANETSILDSAPEIILKEIKNDTDKNLLTDEEYNYLSIKKGSLTADERKEIISHVIHTYNFLKEIPWPESMEWIPNVARWHHETLDGTGYPDGKTGDTLPIESKIMAIADIFDALTASDRSYKKAIPVDKAYKILMDEANRGKLDKDIVNLFITDNIFQVVQMQSE